MSIGRTRIKICGVRTLEIAEAAAAAGADAIGLVRVESSPRYLDAECARRIAATLPPWVVPVAVYADADIDELLAEWPHDWVQLHGQELDVDPALSGRAVIKALPGGGSPEALRRALALWDSHPRVRALLVDAPRAGAGETFDWAPLAALRDTLAKPLLLAGGLSLHNVAEAIRVVRPWAIDVSSGVERERGVKDAGLIREFCAAVRAQGCR